MTGGRRPRGRVIILGAFHGPKAPAGDDRSGHLVEGVPAFKAAMCGNGPCKQVVHVFLLCLGCKTAPCYCSKETTSLRPLRHDFFPVWKEELHARGADEQPFSVVQTSIFELM